jgi:two-component system response regulator FixJ
MESPTVFIVSADAAVRDAVKDLVESTGLHAEILPSLQAFLEAVVEPGRRGCLVFDAPSDDLSDPKQQAGLAAASARLPVLVIISYGDVPIAVRALKAGVLDVVQKPYRDKNLLASIHNALAADTAAPG